MTTSNEMILIGGVVKSLRGFESWCGETHIQKTCYVAKHVYAIPFESQFILYKHGPFSFDLNSAIGQMRAQQILSSTPQSYGSTYDVDSALWNAINTASDNMFEAYKTNVESICKVLAKKKVAELERVVTAVFVYINFFSDNVERMSQKLVELKPHISPREALLAFQEAEVFTSKLRHSV